MNFYQSMSSILSIAVIVSLGYLFAVRRVLDSNAGNVCARLVTSIALPAYMLSNLLQNFERDKLIALGSGLIVPFTSMGVCYLIGYAVSIVLKVEKGHRGTFRSMFFVSNSIFIGLPINVVLFGQESVPYVLLYFIANATFFWTLGVYGISSDGANANPDIFSTDTVRRIFSPPMLGFLAAVLLILLEIKPHKVILDVCRYLGGMMTPLSMLFIGIALHEVEWKEIKPSRDMAGIIVGRFIISPLSVWIIAYFIPIPLLMKKVFFIQAMMPVMTQTSILAKYYQADYKYAAVMTAVTTILMIFLIPLYAGLL